MNYEYLSQWNDAKIFLDYKIEDEAFYKGLLEQSGSASQEDIRKKQSIEEGLKFLKLIIKLRERDESIKAGIKFPKKTLRVETLSDRSLARMMKVARTKIKLWRETMDSLVEKFESPEVGIRQFIYNRMHVRKPKKRRKASYYQKGYEEILSFCQSELDNCTSINFLKLWKKVAEHEKWKDIKYSTFKKFCKKRLCSDPLRGEKFPWKRRKLIEHKKRVEENANRLIKETS